MLSDLAVVWGNRFGRNSRAVRILVGRGMLVVFENEPYRNQLAGQASPRQVSVEVLTVDAVCHELGRVPDWIRMDVQGLAFEVLQGARVAIRDARGHLILEPLP